jgi:uncharacterized linocin/CFP29 family protein
MDMHTTSLTPPLFTSMPMPKWAVMYICGSGSDFAVSFSYDLAVGFLNCSDGVVFLFFILNMLVRTFYINNLYSSNI